VPGVGNFGHQRSLYGYTQAGERNLSRDSNACDRPGRAMRCALHAPASHQLHAGGIRAKSRILTQFPRIVPISRSSSHEARLVSCSAETFSADTGGINPPAR
jgi:hypothetical protein